MAISKWRAARPRDHRGSIDRHRGAIGDAEFITYVTPVPSGCADPQQNLPHFPEELDQRVRQELEHLRGRLEEGAPWRPLLAATGLGAIIHARLQSDAPAVLIMGPRPAGRSQARTLEPLGRPPALPAS